MLKIDTAKYTRVWIVFIGDSTKHELFIANDHLNDFTLLVWFAIKPTSRVSDQPADLVTPTKINPANIIMVCFPAVRDLSVAEAYLTNNNLREP